MWSYYGSKAAIIDNYPPPKYDLIVEPFAGSARYAAKYFYKDVILIDKYEVIVRIWNWILQCSQNDIMSLPKRFKSGQTLDDFKFDCEEAKLLMGFLIGKGLERPRNKPTHRATTHRPNGINFQLKNIASKLELIRHWRVFHGNYDRMSNIEATWFIDPPYQFGGHAYVESNKKLDFTALGEWCKSRMGQTIVCENTKANWLPFVPVVKNKGTHKWKTTEAIWSNIETNFDFVQQPILFG